MDQVTERTIEKTVDFEASIDRVWTAITDQAELSSWFGDETEFEPRPGAEGVFGWKAHGRFAVRVDVVEAPHLLVWSWVHEAGVAFDEAPATRVEWRLTSRSDGGTTLVLAESGFRTDLHHSQNTQGWDSELGKLVALLAA